jgi:hypothetical protein
MDKVQKPSNPDRLRKFENEMLRRVFESHKRQEVAGDYRIVHNEELHILHSSNDKYTHQGE